MVGEVKCPQSDKASCFKPLQKKQSTGSFSIKSKNNELQNYNSLFEETLLADANCLA